MQVKQGGGLSRKKEKMIIRKWNKDKEDIRLESWFWRAKDGLHLRRLLRNLCLWRKIGVNKSKKVEGSFREEVSAFEGAQGRSKGGKSVGEPRPHRAHRDEERDPVTEVHSDGGSDEVNPDHPLGLLCHNFSLGCPSGDHRAAETLMSSGWWELQVWDRKERPLWGHRLGSWKLVDGMCETTQGRGHCGMSRRPSTDFPATPTLRGSRN